MTLLCIKNPTQNSTTKEAIKYSPVQVGNIYHHLETIESEGKFFYVLAELGYICAIRSTCFAMLSELDETELVNEDYKIQTL
jgi:hypothetical protein